MLGEVFIFLHQEVSIVFVLGSSNTLPSGVERIRRDLDLCAFLFWLRMSICGRSCCVAETYEGLPGSSHLERWMLFFVSSLPFLRRSPPWTDLMCRQTLCLERSQESLIETMRWVLSKGQRIEGLAAATTSECRRQLTWNQ